MVQLELSQRWDPEAARLEVYRATIGLVRICILLECLKSLVDHTPLGGAEDAQIRVVVGVDWVEVRSENVDLDGLRRLLEVVHKSLYNVIITFLLQYLREYRRPFHLAAARRRGVPRTRHRERPRWEHVRTHHDRGSGGRFAADDRVALLCEGCFVRSRDAIAVRRFVIEDV